jgi:hypothetical protein
MKIKKILKNPSLVEAKRPTRSASKFDADPKLKEVLSEFARQGVEYHLNPDMTIDLLTPGFEAHSSKVIDGNRLVVSFGKAVTFSYRARKLNSFDGFPREIAGSGGSIPLWSLVIATAGAGEVTNLAGCTPVITGNVDFSSFSGLLTLEGVHKAIKTLNGNLALPAKSVPSSGGLGLLMIRGLKKLVLPSAIYDVTNSTPYLRAAKIIRKHFDNDKDVLACQEELITSGLKEYARL